MTAETAMHSPSTACAECGARLTSCETKRWLSGKACCDGCSHRPQEARYNSDVRPQPASRRPHPRVTQPGSGDNRDRWYTGVAIKGRH